MRTAFLWSGGKDCCLAYHISVNEDYQPVVLVTFMGEKPFICHPLEIAKLQSQALGVPQVRIRVGEPYFDSYRKALSEVSKTYSIEAFVSGDISIADPFHGNFMEKVFDGLDLKFYRPLWEIERSELLKGYISAGIKPIFTCAKKPFFNESWIGRVLDAKCAQDLEILGNQSGIDICGENGEYHTTVLETPLFRKVIKISDFSIESTDTLLYAKINKVSLGSEDCQ